MLLASLTPAQVDAALSAHQTMVIMLNQHLSALEEQFVHAEKANDADRMAEARAHFQREALARAVMVTRVDLLNREYARRGGWNRVWAVAGGRVHNSPHCQRGYSPTTKWAWMVEWSGRTEVDIMHAAGKNACMWCYPKSPRNTPTQIEHPDDQHKREAREGAQRRPRRTARP